MIARNFWRNNENTWILVTLLKRISKIKVVTAINDIVSWRNWFAQIGLLCLIINPTWSSDSFEIPHDSISIYVLAYSLIHFSSYDCVSSLYFYFDTQKLRFALRQAASATGIGWRTYFDSQFVNKTKTKSKKKFHSALVWFRRFIS